MKRTDLLAFIGRLVVGGVLVYAGVAKALAPTAEFAAALSNYQVFPAAFIMPLATALPWLEIWTGLFLIAGLYLPFAAAGATLLFAGFLTAMGIAKLHHVDLTSCGCFGAETLSPKTTFKIDIVLLGIALGLLSASREVRDWTLDRRLPK